ncbi:MAG: beta-phosphoglucomutase [Leptotrichiaceae bacterium]|nr:beta-phosphoglucomutase [Aliarcobacter sp.]MBP9630338.1 beta-phosphoglucomutase [Leptotrichiaceae bacterium]
MENKKEIIKNIEACLFDLDGVIVDTAKYHYLAWKRLANDLGFDFTEEQNEKLKGVSRVKSLEILLEIGELSLNSKDQEELAEKKNNWYIENISKIDESELLPGALDFIKNLKKSNIKVVLGSASKNAVMILDKTGITKYFDAIIDGNKVSKAKPDPEVFILGAKEVGVKPENCLVFEDAEAGVEAAVKGKMKVVGIGSDNLKEANLIVSGLKEMNEIIFA